MMGAVAQTVSSYLPANRYDLCFMPAYAVSCMVAYASPRPKSFGSMNICSLLSRLKLRLRFNRHIRITIMKMTLASVQLDAGLGKGGVIGVIPYDLMAKEMSGAAIGEVQAVDTMHQRKVQLLFLHACVRIPHGMLFSRWVHTYYTWCVFVFALQ